MGKLCNEVISHLRKDSKEWRNLSRKAKNEQMNDLRLIRKLKRR
jgi:hypothetical protein